jgi:sigma-B regulation protein RsbU (phosphoserine phosphatase)
MSDNPHEIPLPSPPRGSRVGGEGNKDAARISEVIFDYAGRIGQERDPELLLELTAGLARDLVSADRCSIWLSDPVSGELSTRVAHGVGKIRIPSGQGLVGTCVRTGEAVLVNDTSTDPRFSKAIDKGSGYRTESLLTVPLRTSRGEVIGACQVLNKPGGFQPRDVDLLWLAASYSATAIETQRAQQEVERARKLQSELEIAREVQRHLFPKHPAKATGLDFAVNCFPAQAVGGDYYNYWQGSDGAFHFALGDVSGKGIAAALLMASIQATLNGLGARRDLPLERMMGELSLLVLEGSMPERYTTLILGTYEPSIRRVCVVNAGHVPPVLIRGGQVVRLEAGGYPVGLLPDSQYDSNSLRIDPGDLLVCVSDGISESMNSEDEEWGEEAIIAIAIDAAARAETAGAIVERLVQGAQAFAAGAPQHDDMTVMALRFTQ